MLTAPLTVLSIRYPSVVYVNRTYHGFKHKVTTSSLVLQPIGGYLMLKTVRGAVNINYWWILYA
jgi:hypothetical protein